MPMVLRVNVRFTPKADITYRDTYCDSDVRLCQQGTLLLVWLLLFEICIAQAIVRD
jgi:hypothetical protein